MTPQEAREAAAVMLAFADGKKIECKLRDRPDQWSILNKPVWNWESAEYRVAPEPWTGKIWVNGDKTAIYRESHDADEWRNEGYRLITAKEVQDD